MRFQCPHCMGIIAIEDCEAGQAVACGQCTRVVVVPVTRVSPGAVIGDFVIQKKLGQGGVGTVYLAQQTSLDRLAAVKVLNVEFSQDHAYVADFVREARAAAHLNHPNIVQAYAVGEEDGLYYFAMEYVEGSSLKQVLAHSGRMVPERALQIMKEVNLALEFAWKNQKLVHRDIKPDNIILTENGGVTLADLGLARKATDFQEEDAEVMGTPQYIPPEALLQKPLDNRSDIYSLGATLYHTITGKFPFLGDNPADTALRHLTDKLVPAKDVIPGLPDNVNKIIEIMLAKRPEHRYVSSTELDKDFARVLDGQMPHHALHKDAQKPIPVEGMQAEAGKKMIMHKPDAARATGAVAPGMATGTGGLNPAASVAAEGGDIQQEEAPPPPPKKKKIKIKISGQTLVAIFMTITLVILGSIGGVIIWQIQKKGRPEEVKYVEDRLQKNIAPNLIQKYVATRDAVNAVGSNTWEKKIFPGMPEKMREELWGEIKEEQAVTVLNLRKEMEDSLRRATDPVSKELIEKIRQKTDIFVEKTLSDWRRVQFDEEKKKWRLQMKQEGAEELKRLAEEEKSRVAAEKAAAIAALEAKKQADAAALQTKLEQEKESSRAEAVALAVKGEYGDAAKAFVRLLACTNPEFVAWGRAKSESYRLAGVFRFKVVSAGDKLQGLKVSGPPGARTWRLSSISNTKVVLENTYIAKDGTMAKRYMPYEINEVPGSLMVELAQKAFEGEFETAETKLMIACYLMARGDLSTFKVQLPSALAGASAKPEAAVIQDEIVRLEPLIRAAQFKELRAAFKLEADKGNMKEAQAIVAKMKAQFPDIYAGVESEIQEVLKNN